MTGHVEINRAFWDDMAEHWVEGGKQLWALKRPQWGIWCETSIDLLPVQMNGMAAIELGCGTGYVSGWMAARGAQVTGVDVSVKQLETARRLASEHGANIRFIEANAEATGLPDASFDFAISEYGAAIWCDPRQWLPEAWRLLKPGGRLVFLGNHPLKMIATPLNGANCDFALHRSYKDLGRLDWTDVEIDPGGVEFNMSFSKWLALFREVGFDLEDYAEIYAPEEASGTRFTVPAEWAKAYPSEQVWFLKKP